MYFSYHTGNSVGGKLMFWSLLLCYFFPPKKPVYLFNHKVYDPNPQPKYSREPITLEYAYPQMQPQAKPKQTVQLDQSTVRDSDDIAQFLTSQKNRRSNFS